MGDEMAFETTCSTPANLLLARTGAPTPPPPTLEKEESALNFVHLSTFPKRNFFLNPDSTCSSTTVLIEMATTQRDSNSVPLKPWNDALPPKP